MSALERCALSARARAIYEFTLILLRLHVVARPVERVALGLRRLASFSCCSRQLFLLLAPLAVPRRVVLEPRANALARAVGVALRRRRPALRAAQSDALVLARVIGTARRRRTPRVRRLLRRAALRLFPRSYRNFITVSCSMQKSSKVAGA